MKISGIDSGIFFLLLLVADGGTNNLFQVQGCNHQPPSEKKEEIKVMERRFHLEAAISIRNQRFSY